MVKFTTVNSDKEINIPKNAEQVKSYTKTGRGADGRDYALLKYQTTRHPVAVVARVILGSFLTVFTLGIAYKTCKPIRRLFCDKISHRFLVQPKNNQSAAQLQPPTPQPAGTPTPPSISSVPTPPNPTPKANSVLEKVKNYSKHDYEKLVKSWSVDDSNHVEEACQLVEQLPVAYDANLKLIESYLDKVGEAIGLQYSQGNQARKADLDRLMSAMATRLYIETKNEQSKNKIDPNVAKLIENKTEEEAKKAVKESLWETFKNQLPNPVPQGVSHKKIYEKVLKDQLEERVKHWSIHDSTHLTEACELMELLPTDDANGNERLLRDYLIAVTKEICLQHSEGNQARKADLEKALNAMATRLYKVQKSHPDTELTELIKNKSEAEAKKAIGQFLYKQFETAALESDDIPLDANLSREEYLNRAIAAQNRRVERHEKQAGKLASNPMVSKIQGWGTDPLYIEEACQIIESVEFNNPKVVEALGEYVQRILLFDLSVALYDNIVSKKSLSVEDIKKSKIVEQCIKFSITAFCKKSQSDDFVPPLGLERFKTFSKEQQWEAAEKFFESQIDGFIHEVKAALPPSNNS